MADAGCPGICAISIGAKVKKKTFGCLPSHGTITHIDAESGLVTVQFDHDEDLMSMAAAQSGVKLAALPNLTLAHRPANAPVTSGPKRPASFDGTPPGGKRRASHAFSQSTLSWTTPTASGGGPSAALTFCRPSPYER